LIDYFAMMGKLGDSELIYVEMHCNNNRK